MALNYFLLTWHCPKPSPWTLMFLSLGLSSLLSLYTFVLFITSFTFSSLVIFSLFCTKCRRLSLLQYKFLLAQLVKSLVVEQGTWVQIPPTPKINWCLDLMVRATIISGRHRFKFYHNYKKKKVYLWHFSTFSLSYIGCKSSAMTWIIFCLRTLATQGHCRLCFILKLLFLLDALDIEKWRFVSDRYCLHSSR
jgi:hypothetical protein